MRHTANHFNHDYDSDDQHHDDDSDDHHHEFQHDNHKRDNHEHFNVFKHDDNDPGGLRAFLPVSYTHLTLPTNREV